MKTAASRTLRRVKSDEVVRQGDFVVAGNGFEPWEGPSGFRANSFLKPIFRALAVPAGTSEKTKEPDQNVRKRL